MNVFDTHRQIVDDYAQYIQSFINISDPEIARQVNDSLSEGRLWPQPLLQFNPAYEQGGTIEEVIASGLVHDDARHIFEGYSLYRHQREAIELGVAGADFVVTSGTGSGKSLTYIGTIFNHLLANQGAEAVAAVIVYPMNALINSQTNEFNTYKDNYERSTGLAFPITFGQYTSQEKEKRRQEMRENPPQVLLTNYMMLELLLTRVQERPIRDAIFENLRHLVFDELHTYRGRQGADVSMLIRRIQSQCKQSVCCIGTSATMVSVGSAESQRWEVARVASTVFGRSFKPDQIVDETLAHSLDDAGTPPSRQALHAAITAKIDADAGETELRTHPVAVWLENRIALEERDGRLARRVPMGFIDVVSALAEDSGAPEESCRLVIETTLQWVSAVNQGIQEGGSRYTLLPFKLHQFIAQTGSVYTTLDQGEERFITLEPGIYKQDDSKKPIFANVFSRATGHPFICVSLANGKLAPREFRAAGNDDEYATDGYLIIGDEIWDPDQDLDYLPAAWVRTRVNGRKVPDSKKRAHFPRKLYFDEYGNCSGTESMRYWGWFMRAPLLFDPTGGVFYDVKTNEGTKLTRLGNEGRSTSTTITAFSILNRLRDAEYSPRDQKLLSFTDNRQDAALQAGHFNDFVQVVRLRAGIRQALETAADGILDYATLGEAIFNSLSLPFRDYGMDAVLDEWRSVSALPEQNPNQVNTKKERFAAFSRSAHADLLLSIADIPVAQFFIPKASGHEAKLITDREFRSYWHGQVAPVGRAPKAARALAEKKRFFHWFLEFPEIITRGGFDCILGNPPYLGGKKISGTFDHSFLQWCKYQYAPAGGLSDLAVYFLRRVASLLRTTGSFALITTNTISQGDSRSGGLLELAKAGYEITFASRSIRWPGLAALEVTLLGVYKGQWNGQRVLDGKAVTFISSLLDDSEDTSDPVQLQENAKGSFIGSVLLGTGFLLEDGDMRALLENDMKNAIVLMPYLSGADLNSSPHQLPQRWAINFGGLSESEAMEYSGPFRIVEERVRPQRLKVKRKTYRDNWWVYAEQCENLYRAIRGKKRVMVVAQTSKTLAFVFVPTGYIYPMMLVVFNTDKDSDFAIFQSNIHYHWAWKYASTLKSDLRYVPTDIERTFPRPKPESTSLLIALGTAGERYHEHRRELMHSLWLGLTKVYNLFHARDLSPETVTQVSKKDADTAAVGFRALLELRCLQVELDLAVRDAYGWQDLDLEHGFHEVETLPKNDRVRYTISPAARREVLKRLLTENHARAKAEAENAVPKSKHSSRKRTAAVAGPDFFG